jgi:hypothetical protein
LAAVRTKPDGEGLVAFFLELVLFVVVVGFADAKLGWPRPGDDRHRR